MFELTDEAFARVRPLDPPTAGAASAGATTAGARRHRLEAAYWPAMARRPWAVWALADVGRSAPIAARPGPPSPRPRPARSASARSASTRSAPAVTKRAT
jgi:hypothetical protein